MTMQKKPAGISRRNLLKAGATGVVAVPLAAILRPQLARAQDMPKLTEDDPAAKALGYKHSVADVDTAANPNFVAGSDCANCQLYTGAADAEWGPCSIFPGKLVNANGWCRTWVKKAG